MAETSSISSLGRSCITLFQRTNRYLQASSSDGHRYSDVLHRELERFQLWARNIAALQDARLPSSLAYRIRNDLKAREAVEKALQYLEDSLLLGQSNARGTRAHSNH
jgi:hypothetical protein